MIQKNILKSYAPEARREFIKAVTERAAFYGITEKKVFPSEVKGDFIFISGRPFPKSLDKKRNDLISRVQKAGFEQTMEEIAYTWFNRFVAIRFMEVNGYLSHGYRVLSHPEGHGEPEILEKAQFIENLEGIEKSEVVKLKTAVGKENELYRMLIIAQCNNLRVAMPFLFERVDDPTELLLPDNLLNTDSIVRKMANEIPEEDWKHVEVVGWLYQFYISDKKDGLMKAKKAYKTEDIPAVTQLFTPNWIVKYLVQNSLGAKWLATYPKSGIRAKMEYYIQPAEQLDEVKAKIKEITPDALNPEELTVMDPACGSGHILVEAYDLLKEIYLERGYRARDIAGLILTKNLFGLEIDDRAAQLAGFMLMMKASADDREIFKKDIKLNIFCLKSGNGAGAHFKEAQELIEIFENAKTFGSLIRVSDDLKKELPTIAKILKKKKTGDIFEQKDAEAVEVLMKQAEILSRRYDCIIANPPYMGGKKYFNPVLKEFANSQYPSTKADLFAMFIERGIEMVGDGDYLGFVTPFVWMFISSYEEMRDSIILNNTIINLIKPSYTAFFESAIVPLMTFTLRKVQMNFRGDYFDLEYLGSADDQPKRFKEALLSDCNKYRYQVSVYDFRNIPGTPIAYWMSKRAQSVFSNSFPLSDIAEPRQGCATSDNNRFLRLWFEVETGRSSFDSGNLEDALKSGRRWFPYNKGGGFRKWYGNQEYLINWERDGEEIKQAVSEKYPYLNGNVDYVVKNRNYYFRESLGWSKITSGGFALRYYPKGFVFDVSGCSIFFDDDKYQKPVLGCMNSPIMSKIMGALSPTLNFEVGQVAQFPIINNFIAKTPKISAVVNKLILIAKEDWDLFETSWGFMEMPVLRFRDNQSNVKDAYDAYISHCKRMTAEMKELEEENNRIFVEAYELQGELMPEVSIEEITLLANPRYRYRGELTDAEIESKLKADTMKELVSYVVGCIMGRYSIDVQGLVYAQAENKKFDPKKYKTFPADEDGIIPITEREWFDDDAASKFFRFIETMWNKKELDENLDFIADSIGRKSNESSRDMIRRYFANDFYKDHCQVYKNRPVYWLFTSGKEEAFQALVYLHRYNEGTLARMRTEYVLPLQTKITRHIEHLIKDKDAASGAAANKIQKEIAVLQKQQAELSKFDEKLRHYADMKIKLDIDDGVKANYVKFGELLEPIKGLKYGSEED